MRILEGERDEKSQIKSRYENESAELKNIKDLNKKDKD